MDWLDYREKLGIGFFDDVKLQYLVTKVCNILEGLVLDSASECIDVDEYFCFCDMTGTVFDNMLYEDYHRSDRMRACIVTIENHSKNLPDFLSYYMAFTNSIKPKKGKYNENALVRQDFVTMIQNKLIESHIPFEILQNGEEYFIFPKGVPEFDEALVSHPLDWLKDYPKAQNAWIKALKQYSEGTSDEASDVADKFRKTLETFFQAFFGGRKTLENYKKIYGDYLKGQNVPKEISGNFETLLQAYTNFINNFAKHRDATSDTLLEYIMYQTGNIIRLLITLKQKGTGDTD